MFDIKIKNLSGEITNRGEFETKEQMDAWVAKHKFVSPKYSIEVLDITAQREAEQAEQTQKEADKEDVRTMLDWIKDHPTMEAKLKKILRVLIKESLK